MVLVQLDPVARSRLDVDAIKSYSSNVCGSRAGLEWFLFSLIWWRVLGWMLMPLRAAPRMCVALGLAVISGYPEETIITSIGHHILSYLPVFVLGQLFPLQEVLDRVPHGGASIGTGVFVFLGFWCIECGEG